MAVLMLGGPLSFAFTAAFEVQATFAAALGTKDCVESASERPSPDPLRREDGLPVPGQAQQRPLVSTLDLRLGVQNIMVSERVSLQ